MNRPGFCIGCQSCITPCEKPKGELTEEEQAHMIDLVRELTPGQGMANYKMTRKSYNLLIED